MLTYALLDEEQIIWLYNEHMTRDFPPNELKQLSTITRMVREGRYEVIAAYQGDQLAAYALMYCPPGESVVLLDYLAVVEHLRGKGVGSQLLEELRLHYSQTADVLLIECERPKTAPDEAEARKRIQFYTRCGAQTTDVRIWLFDVEYAILVLPCVQKVPEMNWAEKMMELYRQMLTPALYKENVRLIRG